MSVPGTRSFVAAFGAGGGLGPLLRSGVLGGLTIVGWVVALVVGPVAAVQLWRFRESGRRAGIILFGFGLLYYVIGLFALRASSASVGQIWRLRRLRCVTVRADFTSSVAVLCRGRVRRSRVTGRCSRRVAPA